MLLKFCVRHCECSKVKLINPCHLAHKQKPLPSSHPSTPHNSPSPSPLACLFCFVLFCVKEPTVGLPPCQRTLYVEQLTAACLLGVVVRLCLFSFFRLLVLPPPRASSCFVFLFCTFTVFVPLPPPAPTQQQQQQQQPFC